MIVEIKHRHTGAVLYATEVDAADQAPIRTAVRHANLRYTNLSDADLSRADLSRANLSRAYLSDADLSDADLSRAYLGDAYLGGADLSRANLSRAYLSDADLSDADLSRADISDVRDDVRSVLDSAPREVAGLLAKLNAGKIDGSVYQGECACLVGTIANLRGCSVFSLDGLLGTDSTRPAERWFCGIGKGSTPATNPIADITHDWICEWLAERGEGPWIKGGGS